MGYYTQNGIKCFSPDDTETEFYLEYDASLSDIIEKVKEKFGSNVNLEDVTVTPEYIHTHALGYDMYDPSDYSNFLKISIDT